MARQSSHDQDELGLALALLAALERRLSLAEASKLLGLEADLAAELRHLRSPRVDVQPSSVRNPVEAEPPCRANVLPFTPRDGRAASLLAEATALLGPTAAP